ncbi:sodium:proton exchanger [Magnetofaba australis]|nr:sodium:proton exchanger [Magnetofaba australis]
MRQFILDSISPVDMISWALTALFFLGAAAINGGDLTLSFIGAGGVVMTMFLVGASVEVMIETLKDVKGIGTLTGFLTNGPEAIVVVVGLATGDILFAASTPLGSNFMNPILLVLAALLTGRLMLTLKVHPAYTVSCLVVTATFAGGFYLVDRAHYLFWVIAVVIASVYFFLRRMPEQEEETDDIAISKSWFFPALLCLIGAGYALDPVVSFASEQSMAPKGVIGFIVLSTLTSWPEFKSTMALLRRGNGVAAVLNIVVSNITNLWLACVGVVVYLMM